MATYILVPGAWHPPSAFAPLTAYLESHGYPVVGIPLRTVNAPTPLTSFDEDVAAIRAAVSTHGPNAIVLTHSYGGVPAMAAASGNSVAQRRREGLEGGVLGVVLVAAFVTRQGQSLLEATGGRQPPWYEEDVSQGHFLRFFLLAGQCRLPQLKCGRTWLRRSDFPIALCNLHQSSRPIPIVCHKHQSFQSPLKSFISITCSHLPHHPTQLLCDLPDGEYLPNRSSQRQPLQLLSTHL